MSLPEKIWPLAPGVFDQRSPRRHLLPKNIFVLLRSPLTFPFPARPQRLLLLPMRAVRFSRASHPLPPGRPTDIRQLHIKFHYVSGISGPIQSLRFKVQKKIINAKYRAAVRAEFPSNLRAQPTFDLNSSEKLATLRSSANEGPGGGGDNSIFFKTFRDLHEERSRRPERILSHAELSLRHASGGTSRFANRKPSSRHHDRWWVDASESVSLELHCQLFTVFFLLLPRFLVPPTAIAVYCDRRRMRPNWGISGRGGLRGRELNVTKRRVEQHFLYKDRASGQIRSTLPVGLTGDQAKAGPLRGAVNPS